MSFPRYERYKDSGVEWLGKVPEHWQVRRLRYSARLVTEKATQQTNPLALENIESWTGRLLPSETKFEGDGTSFRIGDLLFGKLRPYLAKAYLAEFEGEAVGDFHVMRPSPFISGRFLFHQLINRDSIALLDGSTFGSKMPRVGWDFMANMVLATPPIAEQARIADFIAQETAKIDALIEEQRRLIELLMEKRQAVISHAVTKGLNPDAPMKDSGVDWIGTIPYGWPLLPVKYVSTIFVPQRNKPELNTVGDGHPWITMDQMKSEEITESDLWVSIDAAITSGSRPLRSGAVISSCVGNFGSASVTTRDVIINQQLQAFLPTDCVRAKFLRYCVICAKSYFERIGTAATLTYVNQQGFAALPLALPSLDEQDAILRHLSTVTAQIDNLLEKINCALLLLQERRSALISAAVTGKIDVRNYIPKEAA